MSKNFYSINNKVIESKTEEEIKIIKQAAKILCKIIEIAKKNIKVGISTKELDEIIYENILKHNCEPAFKGYRGYPASSCISIDSELVHGIPKKEKKISKSQIVSIDVGLKYEGFYADAATTVLVGEKDNKKWHLLNITYNSILQVLPYIKENVRVGDIGFQIQQYVEKNGYNVIREYVGHTIGRNLHEKPDIPNFGIQSEGERLISGMVICIEPMVSMGDYNTSVLDDGWTVIMKDGSLCAHYEHMILINKESAELLTDENIVKPQIII
ncbi:MAG: type I methionyl aminopeptidase [Endomicrobiia bacterium]